MSRRSRRLGAALGAVTLLALGLTSVSGPSATAVPAASTGDDGYRQTHAVTRTVAAADGATSTVSERDVTVTADQTQNLRGRQRVLISWSGAQPSGGRASNPYGENGLQQEYPVVVMQCRGTDDPSLPPAQQVRPESCWTASVAQRSQVLRTTGDAIWTDDAYADQRDRTRVSGIDPLPSAEECPTADIDPYFTHLTAFDAANGTSFPACDSDSMPPEAAIGAAFPPAEIAAFTDPSGKGSVQFEVRSDVENESLGCNDKTACSIVVVPIAGLSCDTPESPPSLTDKNCRKTGRFEPGSSNFAADGIDQAVGPALWWSASNWRNRFTIPITFGLPPDTCDVLDSRPPTGFYGSELLAQAALQWSPAYCLNKDRFKFQLNQMSDDAGWNLMTSGEGPAAVVSSQHPPQGDDPVGYAPTAVTGFSIGYVIDKPDNAGEYTDLRLNPRLIAKLLTQSYLGSDLGRGHPGMSDNPLAIMTDPEFVKLNAGLSQNPQEAGATVLSLSNSSDVIEQLTEYIDQDEDARSFVAGKPDPWGMVVNPAYKKLDLPRSEIPLLDDFVPTTQNSCRQANPSVYFNQLAAPVTTLRKISEALLDAWPNVQTRCDYDPSTGLYKTGRVDRQSFGSRFVLGIVSLGDAQRFGLRSAALQTSKGRFVGPNDASLGAAVALTKQGRPRAPFTLDQGAVTKAGGAYPGTMIVYTAARLRGLDQGDADHVAQFMRVSSTEGQRVGGGNGRLPGGYLPMRTTGPTGKLVAEAADVADAVEAQRVAGPAGGPDAASGDGSDETDAPGGGNDAPSNNGTSGGLGTIPPGGIPGGGLDDTPGGDGSSTEPGSDSPAAELPVESAATTPTSAVSSGLAGRLLPLLLGLGIVAGLYSAASRFFVRMPRRRS